ncbi:MAG: transketolase family protein [Candidatus Pacebacteria bacterium]|nr:transketolase family protein [Candidatus Paceibacterota bacterium]
MIPRLNSKVYTDDCQQIPTRKGFGEGLAHLATSDEQVVALCADLTESTMMYLFKEKAPNRFVEVGVAEQNLVTVASGMASMGKYPFCASYAMFSPGRNWEQIRTTIAYNNNPVCIVGSHAGVSVGPDGGTHQAIEDIALMRVIPRMTVVYPCDAIEAHKATIAIATARIPAYLRLAREKTGIITTEETAFEIGKAYFVHEPSNGGLAHVGVVATGPLVRLAMLAARDLEKKGIQCKVLNLHTIKPLDTTTLLALAKETQAIVTVEEHQIAGGMGSAVAEFLSQVFPVPIEFIGVHDEFGQSGTPNQLVEHYGMGRESIKMAIERVLTRK